MIKLFLCLCLLFASQGLALSQERVVAFDSNIFYDVYFSSRGGNSYIIRRVKIIDNASIGGEPCLIVKTDRALNNAAGQGYVFLKAVYSIVPSDYFRIESAQ